ncbi:MAG: Holliday junction resolvase RuvX [Gammaproteobacteria bacterium]|nr:Holliday junction resolvase RuvX [Gammaproteobacteria bacterium]
MPERSSRGIPRLVLAFDYGRRRIGVACGDTLSRSATPLRGLRLPDGIVPWREVDARFAEWRPAAVVVGLPYNADGTEGALAQESRAFATQLAERFALPVHLMDERYSSLAAAERLRGARESGARRRRVTKSDIDAAAACVILERWFDETDGGANAISDR